MASSIVQICNSALLKIGARRINDINANGAEAVVCKEFYERSYRYLHSVFYWGFAGVSVNLARNPTAPAHEYEFAYNLPNDLIRVERTFPITNYKIVGNQLHCNEREIGMKYTRRVKEEDIPVYFEQTMMYYLAEQITVSLTESQSKSDSNFAKYKDHLKTAKSLDSQQFPHDGFMDFPLETSRYGGSDSGRFGLGY